MKRQSIPKDKIFANICNQFKIYKEIIRKRQTTQQKIGQEQEQAVHRKGNPNGLQTNKKMLNPSHIQENENITEVFSSMRLATI